MRADGVVAMLALQLQLHQSFHGHHVVIQVRHDDHRAEHQQTDGQTEIMVKQLKRYHIIRTRSSRGVGSTPHSSGDSRQQQSADFYGIHTILPQLRTPSPSTAQHSHARCRIV